MPNALTYKFGRSLEKLVTKGHWPENLDKSKDTELFRSKNLLKSSYKSIVEDDDDTVYNLDNFEYLIDTKLLKGNGINVITNRNKEKSDRFTFSSGIFNFQNKKFSGKDTKVLLHKNIFYCFSC